jgi:putative DNA primase/helicase
MRRGGSHLANRHATSFCQLLILGTPQLKDTDMRSTINKSKSSNAARLVRIVGEGLDEWGNRYVKLRVKGSTQVIPPFKVADLVIAPTQLFAALANAGWNGLTRKARDEVLKKLEERKREAPTFKVATRLGWNGSAFVLPDQTFGRPNMPLETVFGDLDQTMLAKYRTRGSLKEWQGQVAARCTGNSRLIFSVCLAFTGPVLRFVGGPKGGGFQLWGDAETGKTTSAMVAGSVWGCHRGDQRERGFAETWNSTSGKVEVTALAHRDTLLPLDETKLAGATAQQRAQVVTSVTFTLAELTEKQRLTNASSARSWRGFFYSTSNSTLTKLAREGKIEVDDAGRGRMGDIPLPDQAHGIYEDLHGFARGEALSDALQRSCRRYFGTPIRAYLRRLVREAKKVRQFLSGERKSYRRALEKKLTSTRRKPLKRNAGRYATTFAAGSLASHYGIVPWSRKQILQAILKCELDQLRQPDESSDTSRPSIETLRSKLVKFLSENKNSFMNLKAQRPRRGRDDIDAVPGYREKVKKQHWFYLTAKKLEAIIGTGDAVRQLKQALVAEGLMAQKTVGKFVVQRGIFKGGKGSQNFAWVHAIKADILGENRPKAG